MKAITVWQPWAHLIAPLGAKLIETRSWATTYRGDLAIHAGNPQTVDRTEVTRLRGLFPDLAPGLAVGLPTSAIVGVVTLWDVMEMTDEWIAAQVPREVEFGIYAPGRFGWMAQGCPGATGAGAMSRVAEVVGGAG